MSNPYQPRSEADLDDSPGIPHMIQDVCRPVGSILLFGRTGIGKTRFLWQLACAWSRGEAAFNLKPAKPLRITLVEADMYRTDFESMIKDYKKHNVNPSPNLCWFSRDDDTSFNITGAFGKALREHNESWGTDLTIYDAVPDITLGDPNDMRVAYDTLRALASAATNKAYLGVLVQRKGSPQQTEEETETIDNMLGSQGWGRQASTVWQMTAVPSLIWVKHRLCAKPKPIVLSIDAHGVFSLRSEGSQGFILSEAAKGFSSARELAERIQQLPQYKMLAHPYKDRMLRDLIASLIQQGKIVPIAPSKE